MRKQTDTKQELKRKTRQDSRKTERQDSCKDRETETNMNDKNIGTYRTKKKKGK